MSRLRSILKRVRMPVYCLGDSHIGIFDDDRLRRALPFAHFHTVSVEGATASGLPNPNSQSQAGVIFDDTLGRMEATARIIVCLGEVDAGFVIWLRTKSAPTTLLRSFRNAVKNYQTFLTRLAAARRVIVVSAPLPTIRDGDRTSIVGNLRRELNVSQRDRTRLTLLFNRVMQRFCAARKIIYLPLDAASLDAASGVVAERLRHPSATNHHYCSEAYAALLAQHLRGTLCCEWLRWLFTPSSRPPVSA